MSSQDFMGVGCEEVRPRKMWGIAVVLCGVVVSSMLAAVGCWGPEENAEDDVYQSLLESERQMRESLQKQHAVSAEDELAIRLVQSSAAPDGNGAVSNWVMRALAAYHTTLFPRWVARKAAAGRYDVRFICFVSDASGAAQPIGYAWSADLPLQVVRGPRNLSEEELRAEWRGRMRFPSRPAAPASELIP